ncbi:MAG TPA: DUF885 domain-containing protein [Candidatus Limnocylindrales bacterium]|nr:DUF885 domain-containing protein [Candidatus Limnocylindrales bacterium]
MTESQPLIDTFLAQEYDERPVRASGLGLTRFDDRLDDLSASGFERRDAQAAEWLTRFQAVDSAGLSVDEAIDRDLILAVLRGRAILREWAEWRREPLTYIEPITSGVYGLFLDRLRPEHELVDAAIARLEAAPAALEAGKANLDPGLASPLIIRRAMGGTRGAASYCREFLPAEVADGPDRLRLAAAGEQAARALDAFVAFLGDLAERASGTWQLGEERYSRLLQERELLSLDARQLRDRGQAEYDRVAAEMRELSQRTQGGPDFQAVLEQANTVHAADEEGMRQTYEAWTEKARRFLARSALVTLPPGEECAVVPSPPFRRPVVGVAGYSSPPAFSDRLLGHFYVPFLPEGSSPDEIRQRLESNSDGDIPTVSVHETYPGHHWHLVMRKANPRPVRSVFGTPYFSEGWALYAERAMREQGFFEEPIQELYHLNATLFRAARIIVDTSLHLGEMDVEAAVAFMAHKAAMPEPTARVEVGRYCAWPTQASAYLTGCLEILRIRDAYLAARGYAGAAGEAPIDLLRDFHDTLTGSGSLPPALAERAALASTARPAA